MSPESRQQIIALVLGLIFIIGFVLFAQRLGQFLRDRQQQSRVASGTISPTPTPHISSSTSPTPTPYVVTYNSNGKQPVSMTKEPGSIPNTGPELSLVGALIGSFGGGYLLNRFSRKS